MRRLKLRLPAAVLLALVLVTSQTVPALAYGQLAREAQTVGGYTLTIPGEEDASSEESSSEEASAPNEKAPGAQSKAEVPAPEYTNDMDRLQALTGLETDDYKTNLVALEEMIRAGKTSARIAYLTFDDGPFDLTDQYLAVLDKYNVKGAFFTVGKPARAAQYHKILERGHVLCNHTYSHQIFGGLYASPQSFLADVLKQEAFLEQETGIKTNIVRFPGGSPTAKGLRPAIVELLRTNGYGYIDWSVMTGDVAPDKPSAQACAQNVLNGVKNQRISVVLMHDSTTTSLGALPELITGLRNQGFLLLPLIYESSTVKK